MNSKPAKLNPRLEVRLPPYKVVKVVSSLSQNRGWGLTSLNVPNAWTITQGEGITIMVIDTGLPTHRDLESNVLAEDSVNYVPDEDIIDYNGHQTHCCGIAAAENNSFGMVGVAPKSKILVGKALDKDGIGAMEWISKALEYAIEYKPDVVSMSLGSIFSTARMHAAIKKLHEMNIPVVAAAGNDGREGVNYPAKYPETIAVAAFDKNGRPATFNSYGDQVDFAAPGVRIYSTWLNNEYAVLDGTSMATPFIAGVIALLLAKHREQELITGTNDCKTVEEVKNHLTKYADDKGVVGKDKYWGYGVIDVEKLIANGETIPATTTTEAPDGESEPPWYKKFWRWVTKIF